MNPLRRLHTEQRQSPWLDDLTREQLTNGELRRLVERGVRGLTSNPSTFARAVAGSSRYDSQLAELVRTGDLDEAYWAMAVSDVEAALGVLKPVHDASGGEDGFVSLEIAPQLAHDTAATVAAARALHERIDARNLHVKVPATAAGVAAIRQLIADGRNVNVTLIFGLARYEQVIEAYLGGLEERARRDPQADLSGVRSVASFFLSRVDTAVDHRLGELGGEEATAIRGQAALAQAKLAYQLFRRRFSGQRWDALAARGAQLQRPLWASTGTKNPLDPDTRYVDELIGPDTVTTLPPTTLEAVDDHGTVARTVDGGVDFAERTVERLQELGIDLDEVGHDLERDGLTAFTAAYDQVIELLATKSGAFGRAVPA
ncbi:transaldolase [Geodermatophilus chilensis]|jgi:transaldolase|uniref:transaldolase n=1 Tax=Geodermatophilus chilensis TaxID=2035835 RepID=UPI000C2611DE|nr:transaldolase [Geodermatophilus chilensis]MDP9441678.1 transaldolase [Actinomycetota bacterium]